MNFPTGVLLLAVLGGSTSISAVKLPNGWITCKVDDPKHNECMRKAIQRTLPDLLKGIPKLHIATIDPLHFDEILIAQGDGPVSIRLHFKDLDLTGIRNGIVQKIDNDWKTLTAFVTVPVLTVKGKYSINGRILVLPINGRGDAELNLDHFNATIKLAISEETRKGKVYYKVDTLTMDMACDPFRMQFQNLFDGNKQLGDQMSVFLNENWREVWNELRGSMAAAVSEALKQLSNRLFSRIPKNEITPPK